jgi:hypothetical protein
VGVTVSTIGAGYRSGVTISWDRGVRVDWFWGWVRSVVLVVAAITGVWGVWVSISHFSPPFC